ncbi:LAMI_0E16182g1_1 [Lachancea mirantina]|uniref:Transcription initiation factor TFIID subunit 13 n=1 Tax=Lachancea mirantina TaxID=1230905 RepID=A0A1G4JT65_9SACH|nr:LAMI_0E16182g1_1 [Lachancea mirantina]
MSRRLKKTNLFSKDVASLMYAYGDSPQPLPETVQCLDELVSSYLVDICMAAHKTAQTVRRNKIKVEDFKFVLRNDPVKLGRAEELIKLSRIITDAKKLFKSSEGKSLKRMRDGLGLGDEEVDDDTEEPHEEEEKVKKEPQKRKKRKNNKAASIT